MIPTKATLAAVTLTFLFSLVAGAPALESQSRRERKEAAVQESEKPKPVRGGESFELSKAYGETYEAILTYLKKNDYLIDSADREVGQIFTGIDIEGKWRQTGTRLQITLIKESENETTVKIAVTKQKRYKAAQTEPWSDPEVDSAESKQAAAALRQALAEGLDEAADM